MAGVHIAWLSAFFFSRFSEKIRSWCPHYLTVSDIFSGMHPKSTFLLLRYSQFIPPPPLSLFALMRSISFLCSSRNQSWHALLGNGVKGMWKWLPLVDESWKIWGGKNGEEMSEWSKKQSRIWSESDFLYFFQSRQTSYKWVIVMLLSICNSLPVLEDWSLAASIFCRNIIP